MKGYRNFILGFLALFIGAFMFSGCNSKEEPPVIAAPIVNAEALNSVSETEVKAGGRVVLLEIDYLEERLLLKDTKTGDEYWLSYDGKTAFSSSFGSVMVAEELAIGDILDIIVSVNSRTLLTVYEVSDLFVIPDIADYNINLNKGIFHTGDRNYRIYPDTPVLINGVLSRFSDIKESERLEIRGAGHDIYVVLQNGGSGYVRVSGAESFKGGWIEIGNIIKPLENNMLINLPEGDYEMTVSYHKYGGTKRVRVERGKETPVDVSDLKGDLLKMGQIAFSFEPVDANPHVKIDGEAVDHLSPIELEYGVHTLEISAEGYVTLSRYISVGEPLANLDITLEEKKETKKDSKKKEEEEKTDKSDKDKPSPNGELKETFRAGEGNDDGTAGNGGAEVNTGNQGDTGNAGNQGNTGNAANNPPAGNPAANDPSSAGSTTNQLYVDGPEGAEVFFDGSYKGVAPCHFAKVSGTHVITLMKTGCITKSYTVSLGMDSSNESYSFSELETEYADEAGE